MTGRTSFITRRSSIVVGAALAAMAHAFPASAQAAAAAPTPPANATGTLEDIVVTARRVSERAQSVPVAVTSLSSRALAKANVLQASDLQFVIPGLSVAGDIIGGDAQPVFAIRGLAQELFTEPTVVVYFADVPADTRFVGNSLFDLENVQVVRGPQGTLFGKNAIGGAVLLGPAKPKEDFEGSLGSRIGDYGAFEQTGVLNVPLAQGVALRVAGDLVRQDGTIHNLAGPDQNNKDRETGRASLLLAPTDTFQNVTVLQYFDLNQRGNGGILTGASSCAQFSFSCIYTPVADGGFGLGNLPGQVATQQSLGVRTINNPFPNHDQITDRRITNTSTLSIGDITLKNIFGYNSSSYATTKDLDGSTLGLFETAVREKDDGWSDEFQVQGTAIRDTLKWIVGVFHSDATREYTIVNDVFVPVNPTNPATTNSSDRYKSTAVFAQGTQDLSFLIPRLQFTGGYRYTWDERAETIHSYEGAAQTCALLDSSGNPFPFVNAATCSRPVSAEFKAGGYTYGINYKIVPNVMAYVSRNNAYKAGGFNQSVVEPAYISYAPEYVTDTELGIKADWHIAGRPIRTNVSLYNMDFTNIQLNDVNVYQGVSQSLIFNGSAANLKGAEIEINFKPTRQLTLDANVTVAQGKYGTLLTVGSGVPTQLPAGRAFADVPGNTFRLGATYALPVPPAWGELSVGADYYHQNSTPGLVTRPEGSFNTVPSYGIANIRLDWGQVGGLPLDLGLYVKNLTNNTYATTTLDDRFLLAFASKNYGDPRLYGVQLTWRFGAAAYR